MIRDPASISGGRTFNVWVQIYIKSTGSGKAPLVSSSLTIRHTSTSLRHSHSGTSPTSSYGVQFVQDALEGNSCPFGPLSESAMNLATDLKINPTPLKLLRLEKLGHILLHVEHQLFYNNTDVSVYRSSITSENKTQGQQSWGASIGAPRRRCTGPPLPGKGFEDGASGDENTGTTASS